jgi:hypothetical protein
MGMLNLDYALAKLVNLDYSNLRQLTSKVRNCIMMMCLDDPNEMRFLRQMWFTIRILILWSKCNMNMTLIMISHNEKFERWLCALVPSM